MLVYVYILQLHRRNHTLRYLTCNIYAGIRKYLIANYHRNIENCLDLDKNL